MRNDANRRRTFLAARALGAIIATLIDLSIAPALAAIEVDSCAWQRGNIRTRTA